MKASKVLALMLAIMMMASFALAEDSSDNPVVVQVGDSVVRLDKAQPMFDYHYYDIYQQLAQYGVAMTAEYSQEVLQIAIDLMVQRAIIANKLEEMGLSDLSEETATLRDEIQAMFDDEVASYSTYYGLSTEEAIEDFAAMGLTVDLVYSEQEAYIMQQKLMEAVIPEEDVAVSDEEIQAEYSVAQEETKAMFESNPGMFAEYATVYPYDEIFFVPDGFRYVSHILLPMPDDVAAELNDYQTDMNAAQSVIFNLVNEQNATTEEGAEEGGDAATTRTAEEIQADIDAQEAIYNELHDKYEAALQQVLPSMTTLVDEITGKLDAGTSFADLIAEYSTDTDQAAYYPDGYVVSEGTSVWGASFADAAMALENVGDISEPVMSEFGVHIIRYEHTSGPVPLADSIAEIIRSYLRTDKEDVAFSALYESWLAEATPETHPELLKVPELDSAATEPTDAPADEPTDPVEPSADEQEPEEDGSVG